MVEIVANVALDIAALDKVARAAIGANCAGASVGPGTSKIILVVANGADEAKATEVFQNFGTLTLVANPTSVPADGVTEADITLNTLDVELDYMVLKNGVVWGEGSAAPVAGVLTLEFSTDTAGIYRIYVFRKVLNRACGFVDVEATAI